MFEEQRIKWEGQRGLRVHEYWLESGIVETNHRPKAENSKVGLTDSLSEWCHNENLDLQICYDLFTSLAAPRTATIPFSQVLQLISTRSPGWARHRRCLDMDGTTGSLPWCFLIEERNWKQIPEWIYGIENGYDLGAEQGSPELWRPSPVPVLAGGAQLQCLRVTLNPLQNAGNLPHPASSLPFPHRITLALLGKNSFHPNQQNSKSRLKKK